MKDARAAFVEGRPEDAVRIFTPYLEVLDSEAHGIWRLASEQASTNATMAAMKAEEDERKAKLAADGGELELCRSNLQCWGDKHSLFAASACVPEIETRAQYQAEWTDGILEGKFPQFGRGSVPTSVIYIGDKVKFQNGFGAWRTMLYECDYDASSKRVLGVTVSPR